ncbi:hypothetical protein, partial [Akkermansia sp. BIOML-A52]|uniref:hypothetical protein n=1 Tax=Akkermansia sp. BIOML-A52 TaxID=2584608 RepID=UPI00195E0679
ECIPFCAFVSINNTISQDRLLIEITNFTFETGKSAEQGACTPSDPPESTARTGTRPKARKSGGLRKNGRQTQAGGRKKAPLWELYMKGHTGDHFALASQ